MRPVIGRIEDARQVLDAFGIAGRLEHVRRFVWREGTLRLVIDGGPEEPPSGVFYELAAHWETAWLEPLDEVAERTAVQRASAPIIEGRWTRATTGYLLRVGIDLAVPSAIALRSERLYWLVPFQGRPVDQVEQALQRNFTAYANGFLSTCPTVPAARAAGLEGLRARGLLTIG